MGKHTGLELLDQMRMGVEYSKLISVRQAKVRLRPLSIAEHQEVTSAVADFLLSAPEKDKHRITEEVLFAQKTLILASTSEPGSNDPKLTELLVQKMTVGEVMKLFKEYNRFVEQVDPSIDEISKEKLEEMVAALKKSPSQLAELSGSELMDICRYLLATHSIEG